MKGLSKISEWKEEMGDSLTFELHQINVRYRCKDFDYWGDAHALGDPEYESQENEQPTVYDIDRRGWEMDKSAEYIISALMSSSEWSDRFRKDNDWPLFDSIMMAAQGSIPFSIIEHADEFVDGFHNIGIIVATNTPSLTVQRIQSVDERLSVEYNWSQN